MGKIQNNSKNPNEGSLQKSKGVELLSKIRDIPKNK
jgi:hypothetical protein